jgi:adenylyl-sulfate kinase
LLATDLKKSLFVIGHRFRGFLLRFREGGWCGFPEKILGHGKSVFLSPQTINGQASSSYDEEIVTTQANELPKTKLCGPKNPLVIKSVMVIWITGLSGAGKSTIANGIADRLRLIGNKPLMIDDDSLREELCKDLAFSISDRSENIRRAAAIAQIAACSGIVSVCSLISPLRSERESIRIACKSKRIRFVEIYLSTPLETCEQRDPKGLYKKARRGTIPLFTGIDSPYEAPISPEVEIPSQHLSIEESIMLAWKNIEPFLQNTERFS